MRRHAPARAAGDAMSTRTWVVALLLLSAVGWWYSPLSPRVPAVPAVVMEPVTGEGAGAGAAATTGVRCPLPPRVRAGAAPLQSPVPGGFPALRIAGARVTPLAGLSLDARVLSRRDYDFGREADFSPTDLALGWDRMREDAVLGALEIEQRGRWYYYRWQGSPPIPSREIALSSANMHFVPGDAAVAAALARVRKDQRVRIDGWLVQIDADDGWRWRSSLARDDQGAGACELVLACAVTPL